MPAPDPPDSAAGSRLLRRATLVMLIMALAATLAPGVAMADHTVLAGRWQFDGPDASGMKTVDSSGHGNDATLEPGTAFSPDGRFGAALDQRPDLYDVTVPPAAVLEPARVTVTAWVKAAESPGAYRYLVAKGGQGACDLDPSDDNSSFALRTGADERLHFVAWNGVTVSGSESPSADVFDGQWHAVAGVYDGEKVRLFVDGVQVGDGATAPGGVAYGLPDRALRFGSNQCQAHFPALIDEVRVYARALTPAELATLAAGGEFDPGPAPEEPAAQPRNTVRPTIRAEAGAPGTYRCDPGTWEGLAAGAQIRFTWRDVLRGTVASLEPTFAPRTADYGYTYYCAVTATNAAGEGTALSDTVFFTSAGIDTLPPAYGNVAIRGIDVFQTVQPNSGAQMFGFPSGAFLSIPGGGTPTSFRPAGIGSLITSPRPQAATYQGVTLDRLLPTTAKVYVATSGSRNTNPNLRLEVSLVAKRDGKALGAPLVRTVRDLPRADSAVVTLQERDEPGFGALFRLPAAWVAGGDFTLEARVSMPSNTLGATYGVRECDADCASDNQFTLTGVRTQDMPQLVIDAIQLTRTGQTSLARPTTVLSAATQLFPGGSRMKVLPYRATLDITTEAGLTATQIPDSSPASFTCNGVTYAPPNFTTAAAATRACRSNAISALLQAWVTENPARELAVRGGGLFGPIRQVVLERYDLLLAAHDYPLPSGNPEPGWQSNGTLSDISRDAPTDTAPYLTINSRVRPLTAAAHELGHALTAPHADQACGGNSSGQVGEAWAPDNQGRLQGTKFVQGSGFRSGFAQADVPAVPLFDLMSYCADLADTSYRAAGNAWLSARNWNRFRLTLRSFGNRVGYEERPRTTLAATAKLAAKKRPGSPVAVGTVGSTGGAILRILPADRERSSGRTDPGSPVRLRSLTASGKVLLEVGVALRESSELPSGSGGTFTGPIAAKAVTVELVRDGVVVDTVRRSAPPRVRLVSPRAGARVAGKLAVRWRSRDADGDRLTATVRFSPDGGRTWRTVYSGPDEGTARVPGRYLEGTRTARVRVDVSDGFSVATATSQRIRAVGTRPTVRIVSPSQGERLVAGQKVLLVGTAFDDRTASLKGGKLRWFAGQRPLGRGEQVTARLKAGRTVVRLVAEDRLGRRSTARVTVKVQTQRLRILALRFPQVVDGKARRITGAVRVSAPATLRSGGKTYRLGTKARKVTLALPARPRSGLVRSQFILRARGTDATGRIRAVVEVVRR
jgi:hypothetical protein